MKVITVDALEWHDDAEPMPSAPEKTVERLSLYRRLLVTIVSDGRRHVHSHDLASLSGFTAAQVRRDLMVVGYTGNPARGYSAEGLVEAIGTFLDGPEPEAAALVGVGNLGRAILAYFLGRRPGARLVAAFDIDPAKVGRVIQGCRCYSIEEVERCVHDHGIRVGLIAVPANAAAGVADRLARAGVRGLLNFAPVPLRAPAGVYLEQMDMTTWLEKVACFARNEAIGKDGNQ